MKKVADNPPRTCGTCTLCCKLVPVAELAKPAGQRCRHQITHKGCRVYNQSGMPTSCRIWSCVWLVGAGADALDLRRPDRTHYVIDITPDYVTIRDDTGVEPPRTVPVIQIWIDPDYPDAHRDPALRVWLARRGEQGIAALIRFDSSRAMTLFPPALASDGQWHECESNHARGAAHSPDEVAAALEAAGLTVRIEVAI